MNKIPLILIGGGGHCNSCIDVINLEGKYVIEGILDNNEKKGKLLNGYSILGNDELIVELAEKKYHFLITVGQIKSADIRLKIFDQLKKVNAQMATVVSPKAYIASRTTLSPGTIVLHGAIINSGASVGVNTFINTRALIEHDAKIGSHVHISTGAIVNGSCSIADQTFIGSGSVIANNIHIGQRVVIGAGSVVIKNINEAGSYAGNPCKKIRG
jgi:sugar O-acyltransferase (sialic acid O-acetyltransferase NeuD family)